MSDGGGKFDVNGPVVRTSEVVSPATLLRYRMTQLGAPEEVIADVLDAVSRGRVDIHHATDEQLAAQIAAILSGSPIALLALDRQNIDEARTDPELWAEAEQVVQGKVAAVIAWAGPHAGRAYVAHEAELALAAERGRKPRTPLVTALQLIHGQRDVGAPQ